MKVTIHSIKASSEDSRRFIVLANLDGAEHEFELVVSEGPLPLVTGDQNYSFSLLPDFGKTGDIGRLVFAVYSGKTLCYPIVLE